MNKRILFIDNGVINEWSIALNNYRSGSKVFPYVPAQDFLYIGSRLPFNNLYIKLKVPNTTTSEMTVQYYSNGWTDVVELIDETDGLKQSGFINITPNRDTSWVKQTDSSTISGLETVTIYDQYWLRISFDVALDVTTELDWLGSIFSDDNDIAAEFPDLIKTSVLTSYEAGKTNWQEQHVKAAQILEHDLINRGIIDGSENILDRSWYRDASVQKAAEIIFGAFGDDYIDQRKLAREEYGLRLVRRLARVDKNENAIEEERESKSVTGFLSR